MKHRLPFQILFEDDDVIVIDKPSGMLTTHTKLWGREARESQVTAENILNAYVRKGQLKSKKRVWLVHRLDRETSGVMMFAKSERIAEAFRDKWSELTSKTYVATVQGRLDEEEGVFESFLKDDDCTMKVRSVAEGQGGKIARTEWKRLRFVGGDTVVEVRLKTGRKNQIRVHFSEAGHPIVGDVKYGGRKSRDFMLRSVKLSFKHPFSGQIREIATQE